MRKYKRLYQEEAMKNKKLKEELNREKELHQRTLQELQVANHLLLKSNNESTFSK